MGKLYILFAIVYAIAKSVKTLESEPIRILGEFLKNLLLFPLQAIKDFIEWQVKSPEEVKNEPKRRNR
jgi:hypothetical protein